MNFTYIDFIQVQIEMIIWVPLPIDCENNILHSSGTNSVISLIMIKGI